MPKPNPDPDPDREPPADSPPESAVPAAAAFHTTHWSLVSRAGGQGSPHTAEALETLCRAYWAPVYSFIRRRGHSPHEAEDLTQGFFERTLEKGYLGGADRDKGRFRTYLITLLTRYMANEWDRTHRLKRGGGLRFVSLDQGDAEARAPIEPAAHRTPETEYDRRWAETLLQHVLDRLHNEYAIAGFAGRFETLKVFLVDLKGTLSFQEAAASLGLSEAATKSAVHRVRTRYREILRDEIARTVASENDIDAELRHLLQALAG